MLIEMLDNENYESIKKELSQKTSVNSVIIELGLYYINTIIDSESEIYNIENDNTTPYSEGEKNDFIYEYYCEIETSKYCLYELLQIIKLKNTLEVSIQRIETSINDCKYDLYQGFLSDSKSILSISILYSKLLKFKEKISNLSLNIN